MRKSQLDFTGSWKNIPVEGSRERPTLYVFRHGQTIYNEQHIFTGWEDSKLTPLGVEQAKKVAGMLKGKKIDVAIVTSLSRSRDTMAEILKHHPECEEIFTDDRMIERRYGALEGTSHKTYLETHGADELQDIRRSYDHPPPGGESIKEIVEGRVGEFLSDLVAYMKKYHVNVAISAHGNSIRALRKIMEKLGEKETMEIETPWDSYREYRIK